MKSARDVIAQGDLGLVVDYVIDLQRRSDKFEAELEVAKAFLREKAKEKRGSSISVDFQGMMGTITVVFSGLKLKVRKGAELRDMAVNVSKELFAQLTKKTIQVVPALEPEEWLELVEAQGPEVKATIAHFVEVDEQTPKVYVPR